MWNIENQIYVRKVIKPLLLICKIEKEKWVVNAYLLHVLVQVFVFSAFSNKWATEENKCIRKEWDTQILTLAQNTFNTLSTKHVQLPFPTCGMKPKQ